MFVVVCVMLVLHTCCVVFFFFFQAEDGIRDLYVTGVQTCTLPISERERRAKVIYAEGELQASEKLAQAAHIIGAEPAAIQRSEERRVGKECRSRWAA